MKDSTTNVCEVRPTSQLADLDELSIVATAHVIVNLQEHLPQPALSCKGDNRLVTYPRLSLSYGA